MAYWYIEFCDIFFVLSRSMPLKTLTCTMTHTHNGIGEEFVRAAESKIFCHYLWPVVSGLRSISIDISVFEFLKENLKIWLKSFLSSEFMEMTWTSLPADKRRVFFRFASISSNTFHIQLKVHIFSLMYETEKSCFFLKNHPRVFWKIEAPSFFQGREQPVHQPHNGNSLLWLSVSSLNKNKNLKLLFRVILKKGINPR